MRACIYCLFNVYSIFTIFLGMSDVLYIFSMSTLFLISLWVWPSTIVTGFVQTARAIPGLSIYQVLYLSTLSTFCLAIYLCPSSFSSCILADVFVLKSTSGPVLLKHMSHLLLQQTNKNCTLHWRVCQQNFMCPFMYPWYEKNKKILLKWRKKISYKSACFC